MNHQEELDAIIRDIAPSPLVEDNVTWYAENIRELEHRMYRLIKVKRHLMRKDELTGREKRYLNRYRGKINRFAAIIQHRELLLFIGRLRLKRSGAQIPPEASYERTP